MMTSPVAIAMRVLCVASVALPFVLAAPTRPNFIHLMTDDWGWGDVGVYRSPGGGFTKVKTPHIDALARGGKMFTDYHSTSPVCSPSRAGIMTGRFPGEIGIHTALSTNATLNQDRGNVNFLNLQIPTVTHVLQENGYMTGHFGKWHLGATKTPPAPPPTSYGINSSYTFDSVDPNLFNTTASDWPSTSSQVIVDQAIAFIKEAQANNTPFYMNVWLHVSHAKLDPNEEQRKVYATESISEICKTPSTNEKACPHLIFWASQTDADTQIGRLTAALAALEINTRTMLAFTADNGPEDPSVYFNAAGSSGPFRGQKRSLYEGGHRLPFIAHMPGTVPTNVVDHSLISGADWLPTVAKMAGITLPDSVQQTLSGQDISEILMSTSHKTKREKPLMWDWQYGVSGPCWNRAPRMAIRDGSYKLLQNPDQSRIEVYNLDALTDDKKGEFFEAQNVANDASMKTLVSQLSSQVLQWWKTLPNATSEPLPGCEGFPLPTESP